MGDKVTGLYGISTKSVKTVCGLYRVRRVAVGEERLGGVHGEGERHDGLAARPHYDALHPQPEQHRSNLLQQFQQHKHDKESVGFGRNGTFRFRETSSRSANVSFISHLPI